MCFGFMASEFAAIGFPSSGCGRSSHAIVPNHTAQESRHLPQSVFPDWVKVISLGELDQVFDGGDDPEEVVLAASHAPEAEFAMRLVSSPVDDAEKAFLGERCHDFLEGHIDLLPGDADVAIQVIGPPFGVDGERIPEDFCLRFKRQIVHVVKYVALVFLHVTKIGRKGYGNANAMTFSPSGMVSL